MSSSRLASAAAFALACTPALPTPPLVPQDKSAVPIVVPYPPPPARADVILEPPRAAKHPAWVDGQWLWRGARWIWQPGNWVDLAPNQVYAMPYVVRRSDGVLVWFPGTLRPPAAASTAPHADQEDTKQP